MYLTWSYIHSEQNFQISEVMQLMYNEIDTIVNYLYHYLSALICTYILWTWKLVEKSEHIMYKNQIIDGEIIA
jgi:hypothetical protein